MAYMTPPTDTPSPSCTPLTSPASLASPPTPPGIKDYAARIVSFVIIMSRPTPLINSASTSPIICRTSSSLRNISLSRMLTSTRQRVCFVPSVPYFDDAERARLLQNKPGGLIHIMDDQARRSHKKADHMTVEAFSKCWGNHSSFFSEGFLDCNLDSLHPDFISLPPHLYHRCGRWSRWSRINQSFHQSLGLFSGKAIATQAHPKNEDTIRAVSAQQFINPMRAPSTRRMAMFLNDCAIEQQDWEEDDAPNPALGHRPLRPLWTPCSRRYQKHSAVRSTCFLSLMQGLNLLHMSCLNVEESSPIRYIATIHLQ